MNIYCLVRGHRPKRGKAYFDGNIFRAPCRRCDRAMVKLPEQGKWVPADSVLVIETPPRTHARI